MVGIQSNSALVVGIIFFKLFGLELMTDDVVSQCQVDSRLLPLARALSLSLSLSLPLSRLSRSLPLLLLSPLFCVSLVPSFGFCLSESVHVCARVCTCAHTGGCYTHTHTHSKGWWVV